MISLKSNPLNKKYKALILDIDGTIVEGYAGIPSKKVKNAIEKASKKIHIGLATSRPIFFLSDILDNIKLSGPSILSGGCQIVDFPSQKVLWEKTVSFNDMKNVYDLVKTLGVELLVLDSDKGVGEKDIPFSEKSPPKRPLHLWIHEISSSLTDQIITKISHIPTIAIYRIPSWSKVNEDIIITHAQATKQHGIFEVAKLLGINTHEIIGVGDGYNDLPLLMACGLKVAMGNAVPDLKAIADYVAPSVAEDGVADVIEKFIL